MGMQCAVCGKKPVLGNQYVRSGKAKYLGGVGRKVTRHQPAHLLAESAEHPVPGRRLRQAHARLRAVHPQRPGAAAAEAQAVPDADQPVIAEIGSCR